MFCLLVNGDIVRIGLNQLGNNQSRIVLLRPLLVVGIIDFNQSLVGGEEV